MISSEVMLDNLLLLSNYDVNKPNHKKKLALMKYGPIYF